MDRLLLAVTILSGALIVVVLATLRRAHIRVEYSVSWLVAAVTMLVLSRTEPLLDWLAVDFVQSDWNTKQLDKFL